LVLEANPDRWHPERGPSPQQVVFRDDLLAAEALDLVCTTEGRSTW
jgi:hypothetical protein